MAGAKIVPGDAIHGIAAGGLSGAAGVLTHAVVVLPIKRADPCPKGSSGLDLLAVGVALAEVRFLQRRYAGGAGGGKQALFGGVVTLMGPAEELGVAVIVKVGEIVRLGFDTAGLSGGFCGIDPSAVIIGERKDCGLMRGGSVIEGGRRFGSLK